MMMSEPSESLAGSGKSYFMRLCTVLNAALRCSRETHFAESVGPGKTLSLFRLPLLW